MSHPALQIIDEFLQDEDSNAQTRRNAAVALATIGDAEALQRLMRLAISDGDAGVRAAAEAELATACRQSPASLAPALATALADGERAPSCYALMGRLRAQGARLPPLPAALPWLRLALSHCRQARGVVSRWSWASRAMVPGLFATALGAVAAHFYLQSLADKSMRSDHDLGGALLLSLLFFAGPLIAFGTWRTTPYRLHSRGGSGALAEIAWACLWTTVPGAACVAVILSAGPDTAPTDWFIAGMLSLLPPVVAGAIRAGTLAADGALGSVRRLVGGGFASVVGAAAGLVCVTLAAGLLHAISGGFSSVFWICWLPICCGLAAAYAAIDARIPCATGAAADSQRLTICTVVVAVFLAGSALPLVRASGDRSSFGQAIANLDVATLENEPATIDLPVDSLPARIEVNLRSPDRWNLTVDIEPTPPEKESGAYLWRANARPLLQYVAPGSTHELEGNSSASLLLFERNLNDLLRGSHALGAFLDACRGRQHVPPLQLATEDKPPRQQRVVTLSAARTVRFGVKQ